VQRYFAEIIFCVFAIASLKNNQNIELCLYQTQTCFTLIYSLDHEIFVEPPVQNRTRWTWRLTATPRWSGKQWI